jgi:hypothetical protein
VFAQPQIVFKSFSNPRARKCLWITLLRCSKTGVKTPPRTPQNEFASLTARSIGRGAVAPSQTLPMRFATNRNHENGRQHDCRKPKRRSPGRSSNGRQPRERSAATDPKEASGEKRGGDLVRFPARNRFGEAPTLRETRKDRPVRSVARTRPFRSDKGAYPNRFGAFQPARMQSGSKHPAPMPLESPKRPFSGVFRLGWYFGARFARCAL